MAKGFNTNKRKSGNQFSKTFIYQSKKVPFVRGGRRVY